MKWIEDLLSLVYPPVCEICGENSVAFDAGYVCSICRAKPGHLRFIEPPFCERCGLPYAGEINSAFVCGNCRDLNLQFDSARAAVAATEFMLEIIHRYKYGRAMWFEPFLKGLFVSRAAPALSQGGWDGIVPVPLHPWRLREREFNQAERLASHLAAASGLPLLPRLVARALPTQPQASLDRRDRARNVSGVFAVRTGARLDGKRYVVVDDVLTTGATTSAVSAALRKAGAAEILVWTLARGV